MRIAIRWLELIGAIALLSFFFAVAVVYADEKASWAGIALVTVVGAPVFGRVVASLMRRWQIGDFSPRRSAPPRVVSGSVARSLLWMCVLSLGALIAGLAVTGVARWVLLGAALAVFMVAGQAAWLYDGERLDVRILLRWEAWLRPNRLRRELRRERDQRID